MRFRFLPLAGAAVALAAAICAVQAQDSGTAIHVEQAWSRATPPGAPAAAVYVSITNMSGKADRLVSATCARAATIEIHETRMDGGVMRMRPVAGGIVIAPGETVTFAPGGLHLMLTGLTGPLRKGEMLSLVLRFETAGEIGIDLPVLAIGAAGPDHSGQAGRAATLAMAAVVIAPA